MQTLTSITAGKERVVATAALKGPHLRQAESTNIRLQSKHRWVVGGGGSQINPQKEKKQNPLTDARAAPFLPPVQPVLPALLILTGMCVF